MPDQVLQDIKDRLNVADVISSYIQIKKAGVNFKAPCPFHHEKTPSLVISPQKQIWHCFGCGEGGDVFGFVMRYENVDFKEALKILADKAGVQLPAFKPQSPQEQSEKELLMRINDFAARFYHQILTKDPRGKQALEYLEKRGLSHKTIEKWQIGFAPDDFHSLEKALGQKKVSVDDLVKAGVSSRNERGQVYDRFRGRVTFPIYDYHGNTVGFSARILNDDGKSAKYVNSPETVIYNKSRVLFGLNFAKNAIRKLDEAIVVEGQMDCISTHQAGFENVAASSGTALTLEQLNALARLTKNIKFCFDADKAGLTALRRAGELAVKMGFRIKVISLQGVKDPDELVKKSPGLWEKAVKEAAWFMDFYIDLAKKEAPGDTVDQLHFITNSVLPLIGYIPDPLEMDHYIHQLTQKFPTVSERTIRDKVKRVAVGLPAFQDGPKVIIKANALEKELLGGMLVYKEFEGRVFAQASPEEFADEEIRRLVTLLKEGKAAAAGSETVAKEAVFMVESQVEELEGGSGQHLRQLQKSFALFKVNSLKRYLQELNDKIRQAQDAGNKELLADLTKQFAQSSSQRLEFEKLI